MTEHIDSSAQIHASSIIDDGAQIGAQTQIWHFCHIASGAQIGARCVLGQNVYVAPTARVGDGCKVQNNVSLYDGVTLEQDVFVGPSAVFTNVTTPRAHVSRKHAYAQTIVERGASIGANATIICGVRVGQFAMIGAGAVVTRDVDAFALLVGNPARQIGHVCQCGARLPEPAPRADCIRCGAQYLLMDGELYWTNEGAALGEVAHAPRPPEDDEIPDAPDTP
jgi:UDP-2-acetamido-3-amino-2,3-dideoxy-glucuronate N-acetyltransferase